MRDRFRPLKIVFITLALAACQDTDDRSASLAKQQCGSCHAFPDPALLDKQTWASRVLPEMSFRMGLDVAGLSNVSEADMPEVLRTLPPQPLVSEEEWQLIRDYYISRAPDSLSAGTETALPELTQFDATAYTLPVAGNSLLTMIRFDSVQRTYWVGTRKNYLHRLDALFRPQDSVLLDGPPSEILFQPAGGHVFTSMGIMDPNDQPAGSVLALRQSRDTLTLIEGLKRPVDLQQADLDLDGDQDLIVSAFGNFTGGLYAYERNNDGYTMHRVHHFPGTRKAIVRDLTGDGLPDILALVTQGDEHIALFTNRGSFRFSYTVLLRFPPVYGSSYFELADFNQDGNPDILYTNGDNADYSDVLKPYHGVRIFLNDGRNQFTQSWFRPMHGASMARAADFDGDGDLDIAATSFFPDFRKFPQHSFMYFENEGSGWRAYATPLAASARWITFEVADIDSDDDPDIVLAALNFPNGVPKDLFHQWSSEPASLLVLKNKFERKK